MSIHLLRPLMQRRPPPCFRATAGVRGSQPVSLPLPV